MTTLLPYSRIWCAWLAALILVAASGPAHAENGVICGKPKKSGNVTMHVVVKKALDTRIVAVTIHVDASWTAEYKANLFWAAYAVTKADTILPTQTIAKVAMAGKNGWTVTGAGIDNDESDEADQTLSVAPFADQQALCSLSGTASGFAPDGSPGSFRVAISGRTVVLPTFPGMPASIIEQQLIGQLNGQGVPARFATEADFAGGLGVLPHDASVVVMQPLDATGFEEELSDTGLVMQLATLLDTRPPAVTGVPVAMPERGTTLTASPSVSFGGPIQLRYSLDRAETRGEVALFDATGRRLRTLSAGDGSAASAGGVIVWDGRDDGGGVVPNGTYFVRLVSGRVVATTRLVKVW